jgi:hypothetical protein
MPSRSRTLTWNTQSDSDLAGWKVYVGTATGNYSRVIDAGLTTNTGAPTYSLTGLENGKTYYVNLTAYDQTGNESTFGTERSTGAISFEVTTLRRTYA